MKRVASHGRHDLDLESGRVVFRQVRFDLLDELRVVGAGLVEPEHGRSIRGARAADGELHPILNR